MSYITVDYLVVAGGGGGGAGAGGGGGAGGLRTASSVSVAIDSPITVTVGAGGNGCGGYPTGGYANPTVGENSVFHFLAFVCRASAGEDRQEARQGCR